MSWVRSFPDLLHRPANAQLNDAVMVEDNRKYRTNQVWVGWLVVFNVPSTARSFRDGTPIYCPLRRTWSSINAPFRPGFEPWAVAWQSITLPLRKLHYQVLNPGPVVCESRAIHSPTAAFWADVKNPRKRFEMSLIDWLIHYSAFSASKVM